MILEGFEIENWACIKKVSISGLPSTGVIVLHGPNRQGKSSIVQALRACLMDYPSTSSAARVKSACPRGTGEKPVVAVTFRSGDTSYRIKKCFGSSKSEFAIKMPAGSWKVETTSAADAHERTCRHAGGADSAKGLYQLLWLTQAEFHLPNEREFDPDVQARLRGVLGVLQTALDDRFIQCVKERWNKWFSGQRKPHKQHEIKSGCQLAENLAKLDECKSELEQAEGKFAEVEVLVNQSISLESARSDLQRQLHERSGNLQTLCQERERAQERIQARRLAETGHDFAKTEQQAALAEQEQRAEAVRRSIENDNAVAPAERKAEEAQGRAKSAMEERDRLRADLQRKREGQRELQQRHKRVSSKQQALQDAAALTAAQDELNRLESLSEEIGRIERYLSDHPAPDSETLKAQKKNREQATRLQADRDAASLQLTVAPDAGASPAHLAIDGGATLEVAPGAGPVVCGVQRKAKLQIDGWGHVELSRGIDTRGLDQIEDEVRRVDEVFADVVHRFGIAASDPRALDLLMERASENRLRSSELVKRKQEFSRAAPKGLEPLRSRVVELKTKLADVTRDESVGPDALPQASSELDLLASDLRRQITAIDEQTGAIEETLKCAEVSVTACQGDETQAREELAGLKATANSSQQEVERLRSEEQVGQRVHDASRSLAEAEKLLQQTELTDQERTISERIAPVDEAVRALKAQIDETTRKYDVIKGRLQESEGLHARRAALAARVDELTRLTDRDSLEKSAVDRLYSLFEECREKQLGTVLAPIQDRVLGWMRVLNVGDYREVRFNDAFLPDRLINRDATAEFAIGEESTGAQEQIGMLVRLALGSTLASAAEPAVAIFDDPLTHGDVARLNTMRVILRRAAEGDQTLNPPAGPLQILILTCHPEWFRDERATVIDLEDTSVMSRWPI
jgi:DNA repair exonuclease SbcCD ATPase subunit